MFLGLLGFAVSESCALPTNNWTAQAYIAPPALNLAHTFAFVDRVAPVRVRLHALFVLASTRGLMAYELLRVR